MRTFELCVYKLRTKEALDFYMIRFIPVISTAFRCSGLRPTTSGPPRRMSSHGSSCWPLMRRAKIPARSARRYMQSTEFADDIRNFNISDIVGVESTILIPSTSSPLK